MHVGRRRIGHERVARGSADAFAEMVGDAQR
jgi:hypothetical protein